MLEISIYPKPFVLFGVNVGLSVVIAWCALAVLLIGLFFLKRRIDRFTERPKGLQLLLEMAVDGLIRFARGHVGPYAEAVVPMTMTMMLYVFFTTFVEIFGLPPATEDINCTVALGLCSLLSVNIAGFRLRGVKGRIKALCSPSAVAMPIRMITDCVAPFSMGIRLFANVMVGGVIMQLIYLAVPLLLPAAISAYFNVIHVMIQTFVFGMLSLIYTGEALAFEAE